MACQSGDPLLLPDGTVYSRRKEFCPFSVPPLEAYVPLVGEEVAEASIAGQPLPHRTRGEPL